MILFEHFRQKMRVIAKNLFEFLRCKRDAKNVMSLFSTCVAPPCMRINIHSEKTFNIETLMIVSFMPMILIVSPNSGTKDTSKQSNVQLPISSELLQNMSESPSPTVELHQELSGSLAQHTKLLPRVPTPRPRPPNPIPKAPVSEAPGPPPKPPESHPITWKSVFNKSGPPQKNPESPPLPPKPNRETRKERSANVTPNLSTPEPPPKTIEVIQRTSKGDVLDTSVIDNTLVKELTPYKRKQAPEIKVGDNVTETLEQDQYKPVTVTNIEALLITLLAGGIAGGVARTLTAPMDFSKRDYFVHHTDEPYSLMHGIRLIEETYKLKGIRVFYKANMFALIRVIPFSAIQLTAHRKWKMYLKVSQDSPVHLRVGAGALAGVTALTLTYPIDLTLAQMYMLESDDINTYFKAVRHVWTRGGIRGLYRGYFPSIIGIIPYSGISFFTYDALKNQFLDRTRQNSSLYFMLFGAVSGFLGQTTAYPMDVVRRHMQMATPLDTRFQTFRGTILAIFRTKGMKGFYEGLSINWIKGPVSVGVSFATFDKVLALVKRKDEDFG